MSPLPVATLRAQRLHRIEFCRFSEGRALCSCGVLVAALPEPVFDRDEALALAWAAHRREAGAPASKGELGWSHDGLPRVFRVAR